MSGVILGLGLKMVIGVNYWIKYVLKKVRAILVTFWQITFNLNVAIRYKK